MRETEQLAQRFREVILNGKWVTNTNLKEQIDQLPLAEANEQIDNLNTIALLCFHIHYYIKGVLQVLNGGTLDIKDKFSFDAPDLKSEEDWISLKEELWKDAYAFALAIEKIDDSQLSNEFVKAEYGTYRRNLNGMIEHCYYHLGQIVLLKKLISIKAKS